MLYVVDDAITDTGLIKAIKNDSTFFPSAMDGEDIGEFNNYYHDGVASCFAPYMFWPGWTHEKAGTLRQLVIQHLFRGKPYIPFPLKDVAGFEYWCRSFGPGQYLKEHVDEDTFAYADERRFNAPAMGCVWYGFSEADGGFLELHESKIEGFPEEALERDNFQQFVSPADRRERIAYKPNRLVVFEAGRRVHNTTKNVSGVRQVMVVNVWHKDSPPSGIEKNRFYIE